MNRAELGTACLGAAILSCAVFDELILADVMDSGEDKPKETVYLADDEGNRLLDDEDNYITA